MSTRAIILLSGFACIAGTTRIGAEPIFLSRQYPRCTSCHFSPTGGGLLTPYGRALSREELSTFGQSKGSEPGGREQEFLFGLLGGALGPVSLGIDLRPSHLRFESGGFSSTRDFLMNAEIAGALRYANWTFYAQAGRQPRGDDTRVTSFEHWASFETDGGLGARVGRFIPAYGVKFADHNAFTRAALAFDNDDQVYGVELSFNGERHLAQVSLGPGFADSPDEGSRQSLTATGRWQFDLNPQVVLVGSAIFRDSSDIASRNGAVGVALGIAPTSRLTLWGQADARFRQGVPGEPGYTLLAEAALEVYRGVWLRVSPQLRTDVGDPSEGVYRINLGLNLLPRTHWNILLSYFRDSDRKTARTVNAFLAQLHLFL